jgi:hypothetical protein
MFLLPKLYHDTIVPATPGRHYLALGNFIRTEYLFAVMLGT